MENPCPDATVAAYTPEPDAPRRSLQAGIGPDPDRRSARRRIGTIPHRCASHVIVAPRGVRRDRPGARPWCRVGRARPRRRSAHRRHHAPARAGDPGATLRLFARLRPVPNVTLSVASIRRVPSQERAGVPMSRFDGVTYSFTQINDFPAWPKPVTTDAEGRYVLRGLGRELGAALTVHHPRFGLQRIQVGATGDSETKPVTTAARAGPRSSDRRTRDLCRHGQGVSACPTECQSEGNTPPRRTSPSPPNSRLTTKGGFT